MLFRSALPCRLAVAVSVGRDGLNKLLVGSQVALSIVLPFVLGPYVKSTVHIATADPRLHVQSDPPHGVKDDHVAPNVPRLSSGPAAHTFPTTHAPEHPQAAEPVPPPHRTRGLRLVRHHPLGPLARFDDLGSYSYGECFRYR